jgi:hypothetical protein
MDGQRVFVYGNYKIELRTRLRTTGLIAGFPPAASSRAVRHSKSTTGTIDTY